MTGGSRVIQTWIPILLTGWASAYLGHTLLGNDVFHGGVLDWVLAAGLFLPLFMPVWITWGFVCGLVGYNTPEMIRGFEIGWDRAIDLTGRSARYGRLSRREIKRMAHDAVRKSLEGEIEELKATPDEDASLERVEGGPGIESEFAVQASAGPSPGSLSAGDLSDIPESVRIGSPYDASDQEVREYASQGILHPRTNFGVVFRVAFVSRLERREEPITMRVMFATSHPANQAQARNPTTDDAAWLLVTNRNMRWHFVLDGVSSTVLAPTAPAGPRDTSYAGLRPIDVGLDREVMSEHAGPFGATALDFFGFSHDDSSGTWIHVFGLGPGFETDSLMREIHERIAEAHDKRRMPGSE